MQEMSPKDLAVSIWSLARLEYPCSKELKDQLCYQILEVLREIQEEPYLYESGELSGEASQELLNHLDIQEAGSAQDLQ